MNQLLLCVKEATIITITIIITHNYSFKPRLTRYLSESHICIKEERTRKSTDHKCIYTIECVLCTKARHEEDIINERVKKNDL